MVIPIRISLQILLMKKSFFIIFVLFYASKSYKESGDGPRLSSSIQDARGFDTFFSKPKSS